MMTLEKVDASQQVLCALAALAAIDVGLLDANQRLLLADCFWPLGELADSLLETK